MSRLSPPRSCSRAAACAVLGAVTIALGALPLSAASAKSSSSGSSSGTGKIVAPGDPGSAQYQEDVPTAAGSRPVTTLHPASRHSATSSSLPVAVVRQLDSHGNAGRESAALAQATAPPLPGPAHHHGTLLVARPAATATLLTSALLGSGGGVGPLLPIALGLSLAVAIALTLRRWLR